MPISSGAGGKPNSYFNPANALSRRASVSSGGGGFGGGGTPGYYYGSYSGAEPVGIATVAGAAASPRGVQVVDMSGRVPQNAQASVTRDPGTGRRCCPCPSRGRPEMRMPNMPKSKTGTAGGAVTRHGCCVFLIGLLALAVAAGLIAGLYFLITQLTGLRAARGAFYLIPGRRPGDLMWVIYGTLQECEPVTTSSSTTSTTTTATTTVTTDPTNTATAAATTTTTAAATTSGTTLISCASTTFRYQQVTLSGERSGPDPIFVAASAAAAVICQLLLTSSLPAESWGHVTG